MGLYANQMLADFIDRMAKKAKAKQETTRTASQKPSDEKEKTGNTKSKK